MKYLVVFEQDGEGCDYTIGCGIYSEEIEAEDIGDLERMVHEIICDRHGSDEFKLRRAVIAENPRDIDINSIYWKIKRRKQVEYENKIKEQELEELKKLLKKYC
jgi:hypothetical protein